MSEQNMKEIRAAKEYSLCGNMFLAFIITFTAGTLRFEGYMPAGFINIYGPAVLIICLGTWIVLSLFSGALNKWSYEIFAVLFWLLPPLVIYLANDGPEAFRMSILMYLLSEFLAISVIAPAEAVGSVFGLGALPSVIIIVLICTFAYLAGNLFSDKIKKVIAL